MPDPLTVIVLIALFGVNPLGPVAPARIVASPDAYLCDDGTEITVAYPDTGTAVLTWEDGSTATLVVAVSGSGARYVGGGWQWWTKGADRASLAPLAPGEDIAAAAGVTCAPG